MQNTKLICYFVAGIGNNEQNGNFIQKNLSQFLNIKIERVKFRFHTIRSGLRTIAKTYFKCQPLENSPFLNFLFEEIKNDIKNNFFVYVLGHSFGGAIVNRIAQMFSNEDIEYQNILSKLSEEYRKKLENSNKINIEFLHSATELYENEKKKLNEKYIINLNNLKMATFGSIFMAPKVSIGRVNLINYLSIGDVAIKCNKIEPEKYDNLILSLKIKNKIICKLQKQDPESNIIQICLYNNEESLCKKKISIFLWKEHNEYDNLMYIIFYAKDLNIYNLKTLKTSNNINNSQKLPYLTLQNYNNSNSNLLVSNNNNNNNLSFNNNYFKGGFLSRKIKKYINLTKKTKKTKS